MIRFVHFVNDNTGDRMCAPYHYFDFGRNIGVHPIQSSTGRVPPCDAVIYGGGAIGGIIMKGDRHQKVRTHKRIAWGIGRTVTKWQPGQPQPGHPKGFDLLGVRDWPVPEDTNAQYVPCVSCMHPLFDRAYVVSQDAVLFLNAGITRAYPPQVKGLPKLYNTEPMERIIPFLASAEVIVTNSYHGAYWGTLLGRRVVIATPYSSKFHFFKHQPPVIFDGLWQSAAECAMVNTDALSEARELNRAFYAQVKEVIHG